MTKLKELATILDTVSVQPVEIKRLIAQSLNAELKEAIKPPNECRGFGFC